MSTDFMFTSESVTSGHPDKLCDRISDAIVGHHLKLDPTCRVVAECAVSTGIVFLSVKHRGNASTNVAEIAREVIRRVGYTDSAGFRADTCTVLSSVQELPSPVQPIDMQDPGAVLAEDQANVFGFACTHSEALMPLPIMLAHALARRLEEVRSSGTLAYLAPDGKTQVGVEHGAGRPRRIHSLTLIAAQRAAASVDLATLKADLREHVIEPVFADREIRPDAHTRIAVNPEGPILDGGPELHAGLTGRKTAVDTYGEFARHSGAALSGKDPLRIDRVGAYAARHAAKNVVGAGLADQCEVQLSYSIGMAEPVSVNVETRGTSRVAEAEILRRLRAAFDFRVGVIVERMGLRRLPLAHADGFYQRLAAYGHVGRAELELPWERLDRVEELRG